MNKIVKDVSGFEIEFCENGFVINYSGRDKNDEYHSIKKVYTSWENCNSYIKDIIAHASEYTHVEE